MTFPFALMGATLAALASGAPPSVITSYSIHYTKLYEMAAQIAAIPDGRYAFEDWLDDDGAGGAPVRLHCVVGIRGERASIDFSACADQVAGCVNAVRAITLSAVFYVFRLLAPEDIPVNAGCLRPIEVLTRPGTVADCSYNFV